MKQLVVPKGQMLKQAEVTADAITVDGTLLVSGDVKADEICGSGSIVPRPTAHVRRRSGRKSRHGAANSMRANSARRSNGWSSRSIFCVSDIASSLRSSKRWNPAVSVRSAAAPFR